MGLSASTARALIHDDYLTSPELENSQSINHCPHLEHRQPILGTVLQPGITESRTQGAWVQVCAPPRHCVLSSSNEPGGRPARACRGPGAQQGPAPYTVQPPGLPGPTWARYSRSLWARSPQCTGFCEKRQDTPRGRPPGWGRAPQAPLGLRT